VRGYAPGMSVMGSQATLTFRLLESEPAPPGKGHNVMSFEVVSEDGSAPPSILLKASLKMPDHGHPTPEQPIVHEDGGRYTIDPVYMFMPGVWRLDLTALAADGDAGAAIDGAALFFCIEG
jgi:hypothetical protein